MELMLGKRLRALREEAGLSQEKLAALMDTTRMTLAGYETGKRVPDGTFIAKVCEQFGCTPDYLFGLSGYKTKEEYVEFISSADTLTRQLDEVGGGDRENLITCLNWVLSCHHRLKTEFLEDEFVVRRFVNLILPFMNLFRMLEEALETKPLDAVAYAKFLYQMDERKRNAAQLMDELCAMLKENLAEMVEPRELRDALAEEKKRDEELWR